jgi:creatinine amidohydrolase
MIKTSAKILCGMLICFLSISGPAFFREAAEAEKSAGYSIFEGTMVDMTWQEVEKAAEEGAVILMTTAVIEQHGPHMTCGIDAYLGYLLCKLTCRSLESQGIRALIAPPFFWGINSVSHIFPGTFTVRPETMKAVLHDILNSLKSMGFENIYNINAHGDGYHIRTAIEAIRDARESLEINIRYLMSEEEAQRSGITGEALSFFLIHESPPMELGDQEYLDIHAGAFETALASVFLPEMVDMEMARFLPPTKVTIQNIGQWRSDTKTLTPLGYLGDPAKTNTTGAKEYMEESCRMMAVAIARSLNQKK